MEILKFHESNGVGKGSLGSYMDEPLEIGSGCNGKNEGVEDEILQELDSTWQDISDRVTISRIVAETVMKETTKAVFEEATRMVSSKELQVAQFEEELCLQRHACSESNVSNAVLRECLLEQEIQKEVQSLIMKECIVRFQERVEMGSGEQNIEEVHWVEKFREFTLLRQELESIHKSLSSLEYGHWSSQGASDMDHSLRRVLNTHVSAPSSLFEVNGMLEESKAEMPETFESSQLKHMTTEELYHHYKVEITKMKRDHESTVHRMTEDNFTLKRELLKERELKERKSHLPFKRDMELESVKKKSLEVISKLETNLPEVFGYYGIKLDSLLTENRDLKDILSSKVIEIEHLSSKVSDVEEKLSGHVSLEKNLLELVVDLRNRIEDVNAEASISGEVSQILLKECISDFHGDDEEADLKLAIMQEVVSLLHQAAMDEAVVDAKHEFLDVSDVESIIVQEISGIVYETFMKEMIMELKNSELRTLQADERLCFLECKVSEVEKALEIGGQEKNQLKQEKMRLELLVEQNEKSLLDLAATLEKEQQQLQLVNLGLTLLQNSSAEQEALVFQKDKELEVLKTRLEEALREIEVYKEQTGNLTQKLDQEAARLNDVTKEKEGIMLLGKEKDIEQRKLVASLVSPIYELSKLFDDFEHRVAQRIKWNTLRLEGSTFQVHSLIKKANILRRTGLSYKQRLDKRSSDLQKAEAEVDLLGDEVDALLSLLHKVYIGLDHYSPVLQHYSGMMEILKLVKMELSGESTRTMCRTP
ncbi:WPP domain-associated protein-like protein [Drosera capensis]